MASSNRSRNRLEVPGAISLMDKFKLEIAEELGIPNYDQLDKGDIPARVHGKIGGLMVRRMIQFAEQQMVADPRAFQEITEGTPANQEDIQDVQAYVAKYAGINQAINTMEQNQIH